MKSLIIPVLLCFLAASCYAQNIGIGTSSPHPSAILHVDAVDKGILMPRLTIAQMTAISTPAEGLMVFATEAGVPYIYSGGQWKDFSCLR